MMLKRAEATISVNLPWNTICAIACRAMVENVSFEIVFERWATESLEDGLGIKSK